MYKRLAILVITLALAVPALATAQALDVTGTVVSVDHGAQVIVLDGNRTYRLTPQTQVIVNGQPVALGSLAAGQTVHIRTGQTATPGSATTVVTPGAPPPPSPPASVVVTPPASAPPAAPGPSVVVNAPAASPAMTTHTLYGRVTDVGDGEIEIKVEDEEMELDVPRAVSSRLRKGDTVRIDLTFPR
jgi:hypothetical protein